MQVRYKEKEQIMKDCHCDEPSGVARLVGWQGIARPTDCIIRVFDCSIKVYRTFGAS